MSEVIQNDDKVLAKIQKLLKIAEDRGATEHEAKVAMLKAQELMVKYSLNQSDLKDVDLEKHPKKVVTKAVIENKGRIMWYETTLLSIIAKNFRCVYFSRGIIGNRSRNLMLMGLEEDVEIATFVFNFALNQMKILGKNYIKENDHLLEMYGTTKASIKNDYYTGFTRGLRQAFQDQVDKNNWGLVLVKDALVTQEESKLHLRIVKPTGIKPKFDFNQNTIQSGFNEGYDLGENYSKDNKRLN